MATKREKPLHIPLSFTDAIRGLLKVDPKQLKKRVAKKAGPKNAAELPPEERAERALPKAGKKPAAKKRTAKRVAKKKG
jgi:hypothetical protein